MHEFCLVIKLKHVGVAQALISIIHDWIERSSVDILFLEHLMKRLERSALWSWNAVYAFRKVSSCSVNIKQVRLNRWLGKSRYKQKKHSAVLYNYLYLNLFK